MYTPVNPIYYIKVGFKGVKIIKAYFRKCDLSWDSLPLILPMND